MLTLPPLFAERMQALLGDEYAAFEQAVAETESPVSIRLNSGKNVACETSCYPVAWSGSVGYYLPQRPAFTFDPLFHAGAYYVQEASSMFLGEVIKQWIHEPVRYLDLCAAPGGKTTHALSLLPQGSLVAGNEYVRARAAILAENVTKWGSPFSAVTHNSAAEWGAFTHYFDVIATDVPCSGEGMFRKDPDAMGEWSPAAVAACAARQRAILADVWDALRPGGLLIYSTCTYNIEENEAMVAYLVEQYAAEPLPVAIRPEWGVGGALQGDMPVYRFLPHRTRGEGLFMALLRKPGDEPTKRPKHPGREKEKKRGGKKPDVPSAVKQWLRQPDDYVWQLSENTVVAYPQQYADDMLRMQKQLHVLQAGIAVATIKGKDYIPTQALALSQAFDREAFPLCELDYCQAISYLRREAIALPAGVPAGYVVVTYRGFPLGWVKNIGLRANNLYPQEWRIRATHTPDVVPSVGITRL